LKRGECGNGGGVFKLQLERVILSYPISLVLSSLTRPDDDEEEEAEDDGTQGAAVLLLLLAVLSPVWNEKRGTGKEGMREGGFIVFLTVEIKIGGGKEQG
jgi:hypothetical protein